MDTPRPPKEYQGEWFNVLANAFGLNDLRLTRQRKHHSLHYFVCNDQSRYVLSKTRRDPTAIPKPYQYELIRQLHRNGFNQVSLPVESTDGQYTVPGDDSWWTLSNYRSTRRAFAWDLNDSVVAAAHLLVRIHRCGVVSQIDANDLDDETVRPLFWSSFRFARRLEDVAKSFQWWRLDSGDQQLVRAAIQFVVSQCDAVHSWCQSNNMWCITHNDFRPANIRTSPSGLAEVWDWDLSRIDCAMVDVAFASLQFCGRECLFPNISLEAAENFVRFYLLYMELPVCRRWSLTMKWFMVLVVLKRMLHNWHIYDRLELLEKIADDSFLQTPLTARWDSM
jgi:hypothetical protein